MKQKSGYDVKGWAVGRAFQKLRGVEGRRKDYGIALGVGSKEWAFAKSRGRMVCFSDVDYDGIERLWYGRYGRYGRYGGYEWYGVELKLEIHDRG